jgi:hypothetical protein
LWWGVALSEVVYARRGQVHVQFGPVTEAEQAVCPCRSCVRLLLGFALKFGRAFWQMGTCGLA